jgi:hypothetical protein
MKFKEEVTTNLRKLPIGLESTYSQIWDEIFSQGEQSYEIARVSLMWIMCAQRPLRVKEWVAATCYSACISRELDVDVILDICHQLVTIDTTLNVVRYCHLSVFEYLQKYHFAPEHVHYMAAESCMSVFEFSDILSCFEPFEGYAVEHWAIHVKQCVSEEFRQELLGLLQHFLGSAGEPAEAYCNWVRSLGQWSLESYDPNFLRAIFARHTVPNPLFAVAWFPFGGEFPELLELDGAELNCTNDKGFSLLAVACCGGLPGTVQMLLDRGADPNYCAELPQSQNPAVATHGIRFRIAELPASTYRTPLRMAILTNNHKIINMLLEKGAFINGNQPSGTDHTDLLGMVVQYATPEITEVVLARISLVEVTDVVIKAAINNIYHGKEMMQLLLRHGANFQISQDVLTSAMKNYTSWEVLELLLERCPHLRTSEFVLIRAVESGLKTVGRLLESWYNISTTEVAMVAAAESGLETLRKLSLGHRYIYTRDVLL